MEQIIRGFVNTAIHCVLCPRHITLSHFFNVIFSYGLGSDQVSQETFY